MRGNTPQLNVRYCYDGHTDCTCLLYTSDSGRVGVFADVTKSFLHISQEAAERLSDKKITIVQRRVNHFFLRREDIHRVQTPKRESSAGNFF